MAESSLSDFALPGGVGAGLGDGLMRLNLWHSLILFRLVWHKLCNAVHYKLLSNCLTLLNMMWSWILVGLKRCLFSGRPWLASHWNRDMSSKILLCENRTKIQRFLHSIIFWNGTRIRTILWQCFFGHETCGCTAKLFECNDWPCTWYPEWVDHVY